MKILPQITSPHDIKGLSIKELEELAEEIRQFIITNVSETGGHLASSLGAVELTLAMHYVFNTPDDRIVWDVGHQAYAHKIITGRRERFGTLRQKDGLKPFISPDESEYDAFVAGHAGNAVSAASGICEGFRQQKLPHRALAVIGDGSLSNGLTFEGLNCVGNMKQNMIVVLNDNNMFIGDQVGALSDYVSRMMTSSKMRGVTTAVKSALRGVPQYGENLYKAAKYVETNIKGVLADGMLFEELGFRYVGPIDGHNLLHLTQAFENVSRLNEPVFLHLVTQKGKGYSPAVEDPETYHGVSSFHPENGQAKKVKQLESLSDVFGNKLIQMAKEDRRINAITAAMGSGTGLNQFKCALPDNFFDVGIAESHAVTMAAGMAKTGLKPVVAIYSTFLQRSYDQIVHDVALQKLPVVFAIDRAGLVGADGPTHHGVFDIQFLRGIPNLTMMIPRDQEMLEKMLELALEDDQTGPLAIRYPRGNAREKVKKCRSLTKGKAEVLKKGTKAVIFATGPLCYEALAVAEEHEDVAVIDLRFAKPIDGTTIRKHVKACQGRFLVLEDGCVQGGIGSAVLEVLQSIDIPLNYKLLGIPDRFIEHGSQKELMQLLGLDQAGIRKALEEIL